MISLLNHDAIDWFQLVFAIITLCLWASITVRAIPVIKKLPSKAERGQAWLILITIDMVILTGFSNSLDNWNSPRPYAASLPSTFLVFVVRGLFFIMGIVINIRGVRARDYEGDR